MVLDILLAFYLKGKIPHGTNFEEIKKTSS